MIGRGLIQINRGILLRFSKKFDELLFKQPENVQNHIPL